MKSWGSTRRMAVIESRSYMAMRISSLLGGRPPRQLIGQMWEIQERIFSFKRNMLKHWWSEHWRQQAYQTVKSGLRMEWIFVHTRESRHTNAERAGLRAARLFGRGRRPAPEVFNQSIAAKRSDSSSIKECLMAILGSQSRWGNTKVAA